MEKIIFLAVVTMACFQGNRAAVPVVVGGAAQTVTIDEGATAPVEVINIDADVDPIFCPITGPDAASFTSVAAVTADAAETCSITINASPDYDVKTTYIFGVAVTDNANPTHAVAVTVTVNVVNKSPTCPTPGDYATNLADGAGAGTEVADVDATPVTSTDTVTYAINNGNEAGKFAINPTTGVITIATSQTMDASTGPAFALGVFATVGTGTVYTGTCSVFIVVGVCSSSGVSALVASLLLLGTAISGLSMQLF